MLLFNIILFSLLLNFLVWFLRGKKNDNLIYCGLFAWVGAFNTTFSKDRFNMLGVLNQSRGEHSCGVSIDGDILLGVDEHKKYIDFIRACPITNPKEFPTVLGHTRKATYGRHTVFNAHPFGFGKTKKNNPAEYAMIGIHNGTLKNYKELAEKYKVDLKETYNVKGGTATREKIDSEIILEILYKTKDFKVLEEYEGAAALIWYWTENPEEVFFWRGASKKNPNWVNSSVEEERPLFAYQEKKNSMYVSSQDFGLEGIGGSDETIFEFDVNTVYKVTKGNFAKAEKTKIRREVNHRKPKKEPSLPSSRNSGRRDYAYQGPNSHINPNYRQTSLGFNCRVGGTLLADEEWLDHMGSKIQFHGFRFKRNGHNIDGIYCWVPTYGYYFLARTIKDAENRLYDLTNKLFKGKDFITSKEQATNGAFIPFRSSAKNELVDPLRYFHFFFQGVKLRNFEDYDSITAFAGNKILSPEQLSHASLYPVGPAKAKNLGRSNNGLMYNGMEYTGTICPLGSMKKYMIEKGHVTEWATVEEKCYTHFKNPSIKELSDSFKSHPAEEGAVEVDSLAQIELETEKEQDVMDFIGDCVLDVVIDHQKVVENLQKKYKDHAKVKKALTIIHGYTKRMTNLLEVELT